MKLKSKYKRIGIPVIMVVVISLSLGFITLRDKEFEIIKNLDIFYSLFREVDRFYVDEKQPEELIDAAIGGMLESLDPYTTYIAEEDMDNFTFMTTGEYGGIGAVIRRAGDYSMISEPYENFPAQIAGLKAGDTIMSVNGISTKGKEISDVSELLKGTPNTSLELEIKRIGHNGILNKSLVRQKITVPNVPYYGMVANDIGYIRLSGFTRDAGDETKEALERLKESGARSIILDLRANPGGLLQEAVNVSNLFVERGQEIVSTKGKISQWDNVYKTTNNPVDTDIPVVVLVNRGSASASEIVAGALQDLDRAVIVGQRTFGKGLVQTTRPLSYKSQLKVTTAKYYIPSGRCIQAVDYSHRNDDGSVGYIPDSLIREFSTINGRKVYDGGGITPDIQLDPIVVSNITLSLYSKNLIFDYATMYAAEHKSVKRIEDVQISDAVYKEFIDFLKGKNYDYTTRSDEKLDELIQTAKQEKYYDLAEEELNELKSTLSHDKEKDLQTFSSEIKTLLYEEIAGRYFYQKGEIMASLQNDEELTKAIEILNDKELYSTTLSGAFVNEANIKKGMQPEWAY